MELSDQSVLSLYQPIADVNTRHKVLLVQHAKTGEIFIEKKLAQYNLSLFQDLREHPVPDTPRIYELVEGNGFLIVIEEFLPGRTLQDFLDEHDSSGEYDPFPEDEAVSLVLALSRIVRQLHHRNPPIIHRDIKPANIILSQGSALKKPAGDHYALKDSVSKNFATKDSVLDDYALNDHSLKLLDFGASKYVSEDKSQDTVLLGTRGYAAPEQYGFGSSTLQTDIYAIGVLLNVLLTGELPTERLADGRLSAVITKCTQLNPSDRFSDIDELIAVLEKSNCEDTKYIKQGSHGSARLELSEENAASKETDKTVFDQNAADKDTDTESEQDYKDHKDYKVSTESAQSYRRYLPPGFRSGSPVNMAIAIVGYLYLFLSGIELTFPYIAAIFFTADYLNVQSYLPVTRSQNRAVRAIGVALYDLIIIFVLVAISQIL
ncbi:MAG: protein kinase [Clostridiales bacterium]|nr:protein kinase [Clostridiales bacterium]